MMISRGESKERGEKKGCEIGGNRLDDGKG